MDAHSLAAGAVNLGMDSMDISFYSINIAISCIIAQAADFGRIATILIIAKAMNWPLSDLS